MEQSSVEFLINHILHSEFETDEEWKEVFKQAIEKHKDETIDTFHMGMIKHSLMELNDELPKSFEDLDKIIPFKEGNEYYESRFKK